MKKVECKFVITPFLPCYQPALGPSLLKSVLKDRGISSEIVYLNIDYLNKIGNSTYHSITNVTTRGLIGEFLFTKSLWGEHSFSWEFYLSKYSKLLDNCFQQEKELSELRFFYEESPNIVKKWAEELLEDDPKVIAFSSTFQQNVATLALAKEIRRLVPKEKILLIMGGANCEGKMGEAIASYFTFLDHVVSGEGENIIADLVGSYIEKSKNTFGKFVKGVPVKNLNALPYPDFEDYFSMVNQGELSKNVSLAAESSRGCWWGAVSQCKFCGLNGGSISYRKKSADSFINEIDYLSTKYNIKKYMMVDNILDTTYLKDFFPKINNKGFRFFYEVKSSLKKTHLQEMVKGGVVWIQPGIESLSSSILKLMGKGSTLLQNVQFLKWCTELGLEVVWNYLYGFKGEKASDYEAIFPLLQKIGHLIPPSGPIPVRLDRFSPYYENAKKEGITNIRPFEAYNYVYPLLSSKQKMDIAYFFESDSLYNKDAEYVRVLKELILEWNKCSDKGEKLTLIKVKDSTFVLDTRKKEKIKVNDEELKLLKVLDSSISKVNIYSKMNLENEEVDCILNVFEERGWVIEESQRFLSIVTDFYSVIRDLRTIKN